VASLTRSFWGVFSGLLAKDGMQYMNSICNLKWRFSMYFNTVVDSFPALVGTALTSLLYLTLWCFNGPSATSGYSRQLRYIKGHLCVKDTTSACCVSRYSASANIYLTSRIEEVYTRRVQFPCNSWSIEMSAVSSLLLLVGNI
jgi:hypothetical protein